MVQRRLRSLVLLVLHECAAHGLNLDFLTTKGRATNDEDEVDLFELTTTGDEEEGSGRQLLNVVTIAAFNSTLLQLGKYLGGVRHINV